jgi:hypothetical protein
VLRGGGRRVAGVFEPGRAGYFNHIVSTQIVGPNAILRVLPGIVQPSKKRRPRSVSKKSLIFDDS